MKHLLIVLAAWVLAATAQAGDIITITNFTNRETWAFGEQWVETLNAYVVDENQDEPFDEDPWVSGVVGTVAIDYGQSIGVADQNSYVNDGSVSASFHAQGFASGDVVSGGEDANNFVDGWAEGRSEARLAFRVEVPVDFVLTGTLWSSGVGNENSGESHGSANIDAFHGQPFATYVTAVSDQIPLQVAGTLVPGVTYGISLLARADAHTNYDDDTNTGYHYYGAAGFDFDMFLTPSMSAVGDEPGGALSVTAYPNPSPGRTRLQYAAPQGAPGTVEIFDVRGHLLRRWDDVPASGAPLDWDGRGPGGRPAAAGTYFVRARSGSEEARHKLVLSR